MNDELENKIQSLLIGIMSDGFNRSINALDDAGALNTKKLKSEYKGTGSKYYDIVTNELEGTALDATSAIKELIAKAIIESDDKTDI